MNDTDMSDLDTSLDMIHDVLVEIRDLLKPPDVITPPVQSALFPNDLGPCTVEFCTEKSARINFEADDLGKLFVPFSRMPAGVQERCEKKESFDEFFVGDWIYERLKEQTKEDRAKDGRGKTHSDSFEDCLKGGPSYNRPDNHDDIPF